MIDASIAALCFWLMGWGFAAGEDKGGFIGGSGFAADNVYNGAGEGGSDGWEGWFFQWAFTGAIFAISLFRAIRIPIMTSASARSMRYHCRRLCC